MIIDLRFIHLRGPDGSSRLGCIADDGRFLEGEEKQGAMIASAAGRMACSFAE